MTGYFTKTPPIKVVLDKRYYNMLIQSLITNERITDGQFSEIANRLKTKLLTYSVPKEEVDNITIDIRLYNNEAARLIEQLLFLYEQNVKVDSDYYSALVKIREERKKQREE